MPTRNSWNSNIPVSISMGGTNSASMTNTDGVCYFDGTRVATTNVGNAGQILTSNGAAVAPSFQASPISSTWVKLSTVTANASPSISFTSLISPTYRTYVLVFNDITTALGSTLYMTLSSDNGNTYASSNYNSGLLYVSYNGSSFTNQNSSVNFFAFTGAGTPPGASGTLWLYNLGVNDSPHIQGDFAVGTYYFEKIYGMLNANATYNAIKLQFDSGNIDSGTITLYGVIQ